ncbi:DUF2157 domain-containing protein [Psychrobacter jeotgali]|uniref:DUF2157 domain-containing protein n=1 Tax=Psychrobacter jeotgali TaxID=179010 RepID=UPI001917D777|nr:DUF2157 domain-containing protein [Psychrobacter jeotgali]
MTQARRTIEQLLDQGSLPLEHAEAAATHLEVYPTKQTWLIFFDRLLLIIGTVTLLLSLVFFVAYNWQYLGKMGKFALVEVALVLTLALYVALSFRRRFKFIRQLLLLISSVITGSLLALFGQVYQTGADTWQLFFSWALLIIPWVLIARFSALWLLWLGLVNASLLLYLAVADLSFISYPYQDLFRVAILALANFAALNLWLITLEKPHKKPLIDTKTSLHWSTYIVGLLSTYFATHLAIVTVFDNGYLLTTLLSLALWASWCGFIYWCFYLQQVDVLMLTYLCFSIITVVMFWASRLLLEDWQAGGFLALTLLLLAMSSVAVVWLRKVANSDRISADCPSHRGADYE